MAISFSPIRSRPTNGAMSWHCMLDKLTPKPSSKEWIRSNSFESQNKINGPVKICCNTWAEIILLHHGEQLRQMHHASLFDSDFRRLLGEFVSGLSLIRFCFGAIDDQ